MKISKKLMGELEEVAGVKNSETEEATAVIELFEETKDTVYGVFTSFYSTKETQIGEPYFHKKAAQEYADRLNTYLPHAYTVKPIKTADTL